MKLFRLLIALALSLAVPTAAIAAGFVSLSSTGEPYGSPSTYSSPAAESSKIITTRASNLYLVYAYATSAGLLMTFDATAVPSDGAVTPIECIPVAANNASSHEVTIADKYANGIVVVFSSGTNCFSKTASSVALFRVRYQ